MPLVKAGTVCEVVVALLAWMAVHPGGEPPAKAEASVAWRTE